MKTMKAAVLAIMSGGLALGVAATVDVSQLPPAADQPGVAYAADIKPIFDGHCVKCHGPETAKAKLRLDSLEAALKGGKHGQVVKPGDSAGSQLVLSVAHVGDSGLFMPKDRKDKPLSPGQVGLIRAWIDQGAK
jgi:hypothetical protein